MRRLVRIVGWLNSAEGTIHLIVSAIGLWGLIATGAWDPRLITPVVENFLFGLFSIATGQLMAHVEVCPNGGKCEHGQGDNPDEG
jgi:hypothetical protein